MSGQPDLADIAHPLSARQVIGSELQCPLIRDIENPALIHLRAADVEAHLKRSALTEPQHLGRIPTLDTRSGQYIQQKRPVLFVTIDVHGRESGSSLEIRKRPVEGNLTADDNPQRNLFGSWFDSGIRILPAGTDYRTDDQGRG